MTEDLYPMDERKLPSLLGRYGGTLSEGDQALLQVLHEYEASGHCKLQKLTPLLWGSGAAERYAELFRLGATLWSRPAEEELFACFSHAQARRTADLMPLALTLDASAIVTPARADLLDPRFLLPAFAGVLGADSALPPGVFVSSGALRLTLACAALVDLGIRRLAHLVLARFRALLKAMAVDEFEPRPQLVYLTTLLRNSLGSDAQRLPCLLAAFLGSAAELMLRPWEPLYGPVCNFLLLRPTLELDQVPEFFRLFHSAHPEHHRKERLWILGLLCSGLREQRDFRIIENRFGFRLLLSFFDCALATTAERTLILKALRRAAAFRGPAVQLVRRHGALAWLLAQAPRPDEDAASFAVAKARLLLLLAASLRSPSRDGAPTELGSLLLGSLQLAAAHLAAPIKDQPELEEQLRTLSAELAVQQAAKTLVLD